MPSIFTNNGYIVSIVHDGNATDQTYERIEEALRERPTAPVGYDYRLREDTLEWELYRLPEPAADDEDAEATEADYQSALEEIGVAL